MNAPSHDPGDLVAGFMLQITQHAERLAVLDRRMADQFREIDSRLDELTRGLAETGERVSAVHNLAARQSALLETLDDLDQQVAALAERLTKMAASGSSDTDGEPYQPAPAPRWWKLEGTEREEALARLRAWVEQVYRPGYGHLSATLGPCWDQHPICLYGLDWLMELWSALYLTPKRQVPALASQAEWQTRLLPGLAEQIHIETTRCKHGQPASGIEKALNARRGATCPQPPAS